MATEIITLKDFVRESLLELINGVAEAQKKLPTGAIVNPSGTHFHDGIPQFYPGKSVGPTSSRVGTVVEFDVAITTTLRDGSQGGIGVLFPGITAGGKISTGSEEIAANRMKFSIPIFYTEG